jgi:hypothetical protein
MDFFGIGAALRAMARVYSETARATGRTNMLLDSVQPGDRIVCPTDQQARDLQRRMYERGMQGVDVIAVDPRNPGRLYERGTSKGRTVFEHTWVEGFYMNTLEEAMQHLGTLQQRISGYGEAHRQTRRAALEARMWDPATPLHEVAHLQRELGVEPKPVEVLGRELGGRTKATLHPKVQKAMDDEDKDRPQFINPFDPEDKP